MENKRSSYGDIAELETRLLEMYLEKAKDLGKKVLIYTDEKKYEDLRENRELFLGERFYLLMDKEKEYVQDMVPLAYHLIETDEGRTYANVILRGEDPRT